MVRSMAIRARVIDGSVGRDVKLESPPTIEMDALPHACDYLSRRNCNRSRIPWRYKYALKITVDSIYLRPMDRLRSRISIPR